MSRVPLVEPDHLPPSMRALYDSADQSDWSLRRSAQAFAHHPELLTTYEGWYEQWHGNLTQHAVLDLRIKELLRLRVAELNGCAACQSARLAPEHVAEEEITGGIATSSALSERERAGLDFAEAMALNHHEIDDEFVASVRAHFDDAEMLELAMMIGVYIGFGRVMATLQLEDTTCAIATPGA